MGKIRFFQKSKGRFYLSLLFILVIIYNFHLLINTDIYKRDVNDESETSDKQKPERIRDFVNEISQDEIDQLLKLVQIKERKHFNNKANRTFADRLGCLSLLRVNSILKYQSVKNHELMDEITRFLKLDVNSNFIVSTPEFENHYKNISKFYTFIQSTPKLKFEALNKNEKKVTFLIAGWDKHYVQMKSTIIMLRKHFRKLNLIVYDLGLVNNTDKEIKQLCKCDFRKFDPDRLYRNISAHIADLRTFSWRPLIIQEALKDFETVIYLWLPTRVKSNKIKQLVQRTESVGGFLSTYNRINLNCYTDHRMYDWFDATNKMRIRLKNVSSLDEEVMIFRRNLMTSLVMKAWVSCAIEEECIAPKGVNLNCTIQDWMRCKCHRFDQSALNVLISYFYSFPRDFQFRPAFALTPDAKLIFDSKSGPLSINANF